MFSVDSNAIKFTPEGKVGIKLYVVSEPYLESKRKHAEKNSIDQSKVSDIVKKEDKCLSPKQSPCHQRKASQKNDEPNILNRNETLNDDDEPTSNGNASMVLEEEENDSDEMQETTVWLRCDVYDTGIGIPGNSRGLSFTTMEKLSVLMNFFNLEVITSILT